MASASAGGGCSATSSVAPFARVRTAGSWSAAVVRTVLVTMFASLLAKSVGCCRRPFARPRRADDPLGRRGSAAAAGRPGTDHAADRRGGHRGCPGPRGRAAVAAIRRRLSAANRWHLSHPSRRTHPPPAPRSRTLWPGNCRRKRRRPPIGKGPEVTDEPSGLPRTTRRTPPSRSCGRPTTPPRS